MIIEILKKYKIRKMKNNLLIIVVFTLFIIFSSLFIFAYYTNTNKFYDDSRKNDGNSGLALQRSADEFIINGSGNGTMLDTVTGMTWDINLNHSEKWATNDTYAEPTWNSATKTYSYPSGKANYPAFSYCEDSVQGNYNDYRLPTRDELMTLIDNIDATCSTLISFGFRNCQDWYWAEDEYKPSPSSAWVVIFVNTVDAYRTKTEPHYVVCVRRD